MIMAEKKSVSTNATALKGLSESQNETHSLPTFEERLALLPENYREQILRQYELSDKKYTVIDVLRWANPLEIGLMILGTLVAIGAGPISLKII
jgi:hypothetical protein